MKNIFRKEVLIGVVVAASLVLLFLGIDFLKGINVFKAANYYYASYTNVEGLAVSAPVTVNGFKVGQVREICYEYDNPGHVLVEFSLDKKLVLPRGTEAVIKSDILGTAVIELKMGTDTDAHMVGDKLPGVVASGLMDNVSNSLLPAVSDIMPKIDSLLTSINRLVADPALAKSIKRFDAITSDLENTTKSLSKSMAAMPHVANDVSAITANLSKTSVELAQLSHQMNELPLDSIANNVEVMSANLKALSAQLNNPESTIGKLTHDPALYNNINATITSLDSLFVDIKKNPKRYISIKLL